MKTIDEKRAEFPTKYGQVQTPGPTSTPGPTPILGLTEGMTETAIQLRFAGYKDGLQKAANAELDATSIRIGNLVHAADKERHAKVLKSGDVRQRALNEEKKRYQAELREVQGRHAAARAEIERHHKTGTETAIQTYIRQTAPMNAEMVAERDRVTNEVIEKIAAAKAEMDPAMEVAKTARLAAEAERKAKAEERKAKAEALAAAAANDIAALEDALASASDEELEAAAAIEAARAPDVSEAGRS